MAGRSWPAGKRDKRQLGELMERCIKGGTMILIRASLNEPGHISCSVRKIAGTGSVELGYATSSKAETATRTALRMALWTLERQDG